LSSPPLRSEALSLYLESDFLTLRGLNAGSDAFIVFLTQFISRMNETRLNEAYALDCCFPVRSELRCFPVDVEAAAPGVERSWRNESYTCEYLVNGVESVAKWLS
jgi:hypothetical protein